MIEDVTVFLDCGREDAFIDVSSWEISLSEVRGFVGVIKLKFKGFGDLIIWRKAYVSVCQ